MYCILHSLSRLPFPATVSGNVHILLLLATARLRSKTKGCINSFAKLRKLEVARGNKTAVPVTYVICPNTVFNMKNEIWEMNGNTNYLCGTDGSSENKCVVTGGDIHFLIYEFSLDKSNKENILISGFTFQNAKSINGQIAYQGKHTIRDCIFRGSSTLGVLQVAFYIPPELHLRSRTLRSEDTFDYKKDYMNYIKDKNLQQERMLNMKDRSLLIGGGSSPRETLHLDRVQFLNNSLISDIGDFPSLAVNGPLDIFSAFSDVTVTNCLFKDNYYPYNREIFTNGFGIRVATSSTLNISNSCFVNEYYEGTAPILIHSDSGLISSQNNFVTETPLYEGGGGPISPCQYMIKQEAYKCIAPESKVCNLPACAASYKLYNARPDKVVNTIVNGGTIKSPPCNLNIEAFLPCATTGETVTVQLLHLNGTVVKTRNQVAPFFLFGNNQANIAAGKLESGTYKIQAVANGIVQPAPSTFTLSGRCVRS